MQEATLKGIVREFVIGKEIVKVETAMGFTFLDISDEWLPRLFIGSDIDVTKGNYYFRNGHFVTLPMEIIFNCKAYSKFDYEIEQSKKHLFEMETRRIKVDPLRKIFREQQDKLANAISFLPSGEDRRIAINEVFKFRAMEDEVVEKSRNIDLGGNMVPFVPVISNDILSVDEQMDMIGMYGLHNFWNNMEDEDEYYADFLDFLSWSNNRRRLKKESYFIYNANAYDICNAGKINQEPLNVEETIAMYVQGYGSYIAPAITYIFGTKIYNGESNPVIAIRRDQDDLDKTYYDLAPNENYKEKGSCAKKTFFARTA